MCCSDRFYGMLIIIRQLLEKGRMEELEKYLNEMIEYYEKYAK